MIYLDGTKFFFDIEGCFSNLAAQAREQNKGKEHDKTAAEFCKGFGKFFKIDPKFVKVGENYSTVLKALMSKDDSVLIPEYDISLEHYRGAFIDNGVLTFVKNHDMKIKVEEIAKIANEKEINTIFFSNPCCPTSIEMPIEDIKKLAKMTKAQIIVDESYCIDESNSAIGLVSEFENVFVTKKMHFAGNPVFICGKNISQFDCKISAQEQAVGTMIFAHDSALKTAQRKILDSQGSLYIRIKKLAIKYDALERLYRSKASCVFFKVKNAEERAKSLFAKDIYVHTDKEYFCVFAGGKDENEAVLKALEDILI